jgi:large subunit ribosomal protein L7/L12
MSEKLTTDQVLEAVSQWSLLEVSDFVKKFEEKFDVSAAAAPVAIAAAPAAGGGEAAPEKTEFTVVLTSGGSQKIKVIKEVRTLVPELGLKEAKALVDEAPKDVLVDVSKEAAENAKKVLEEAGATVEIK